MKHDGMYLRIAAEYAKESKARRAQVGACLVTTNGVILGGYNGTPPGWDNNCEDEVDGKLVTKADVIHAEENALLKAAREGVSTKGATMYLTLEPCRKCSALMAAAGILRVVYQKEYHSQTTNGSGTVALSNNGVLVEKYNAD